MRPQPILAASFLVLALGGASAAQTVLQSVAASGSQGDGASFGIAVTPSGGHVAFASRASNLVAGDANGACDVFVRDTHSGVVELVSRSSSGVQGNADSGPSELGSGHVALSDDGRYVAFASLASNLVPGDANGLWDVFVRDRVSGQTWRASRPPAGGDANGPSAFFGSRQWMSADGRYIAFESLATNLLGTAQGIRHVYRWDRLTGALLGVSANPSGVPANASCGVPSLSADGRFAAFHSGASNLVPQGANGEAQVFVRDLATGAVALVSATVAGALGDADAFCDQISRDGRFVAFTSRATDLVPGDTNASRDVFVRDLLLGATRRASVNALGVQGNSDSSAAAISEHGRFVAFRTRATNLVPGLGAGDLLEDVVRKDLATHSLAGVSVSASGAAGDGASGGPFLTAGGSRCAFSSQATNLVSGGTSAVGHAFLRTVEPCPQLSFYCVAAPHSAGCAASIGGGGTLSLGDGFDFWLSCGSVVSKSIGVLTYGTDGHALVPFAGGALCVLAPKRTPAVASGGGAGPIDCSGSLAFNFEAYALSGADPELVPGAVVHAQWWFRDQGASSGVGLSNALRFELCP